MTTSPPKDTRHDEILQMVTALAAGDLTVRVQPSDRGDMCDAVMTGLNTLAEKFGERRIAREADNRLGEILEVLMAFARLDFGAKATLSDGTDELDALAAGLNMLGEELEQAHERLGHLNRVLRAIRKVDRIMVSEKDQDRLIHAVCRTLVEARGYRRVWVRLVDESGPAAFAEARSDAPSLAEPMANPEPPPCLQEALSAQQLLTLQRDQTPCTQCPHTSTCPLLQGMMVAIRHEGFTFGVFGAETLDLNVDDEEEHDLFEEVAADVGLALHNANVEEQRATAERELKKAHRELRDTTAQIVHTARLAALGELAAGVAHELNQPLNGIKIITQSTLRYSDGLDPRELESNLSETLTLVDAMAETIDHMRLFARRGDTDDNRDVPVRTLVTGALKLVGQQARDHGIEVVVDVANSLPLISCNPVRLEQALLNLVVNARDCLDACEKPNKRIDIRAYLRAGGGPDGQMLVIEVVDNGTGVPENVRAQVFEPFFTTKPPGAGTGLGLSIAAKTVEQHHGLLELESTEGEGALFRVTVPMRPPAGDRAERST